MCILNILLRKIQASCYISVLPLSLCPRKLKLKAKNNNVGNFRAEGRPSSGIGGPTHESSIYNFLQWQQASALISPAIMRVNN